MFRITVRIAFIVNLSPSLVRPLTETETHRERDRQTDRQKALYVLAVVLLS